MENWEHTIEIVAKSEDQCKIYGWLSKAVDKDGSPIIDSQGDIIPPAELEKAAERFLAESRRGDFMHDGNASSNAIDSHFTTPEIRKAQGFPTPDDQTVGWWIGLKIPPEHFAKVKVGTVRAFSIGGTGRREEVNG